MPAVTMDATAQVVRGPGGRVVVIFWGDGAEGEAATWAARGYRVDTVDRSWLGQ